MSIPGPGPVQVCPVVLDRLFDRGGGPAADAAGLTRMASLLEQAPCRPRQGPDRIAPSRREGCRAARGQPACRPRSQHEVLHSWRSPCVPAGFSRCPFPRSCSVRRSVSPRRKVEPRANCSERRCGATSKRARWRPEQPGPGELDSTCEEDREGRQARGRRFAPVRRDKPTRCCECKSRTVKE